MLRHTHKAVPADPLFNSFREGDEKAFDQLFRQFFPALSYFAHELIQHSADAEDIVQDCFVRLWNRRKKLNHIENFKTYMYTAVRYECIRYRQKREKNVVPHDIAIEEQRIDDMLIKTETARELFIIVEQLPLASRQVIELYYKEGKSTQEIADLLSIGTEAVQKRRYRALLILRKTIIRLS